MKPFKQRIVDYVRAMPDDELLDLVKARLDDPPGLPELDTKAPPEPWVTARRNTAKRQAKVRKLKRQKAKQTKAIEGAAVRKLVLEIVRTGRGIAAGEIADRAMDKSPGLTRSRIDGAVRALKNDGRIHQGGDRRFARYATSKRVADKASLEARRNASGPTTKN